MKRFTLIFISFLCVCSMSAAEIQIIMNSVSKTMSLSNKETGENVETGEADKNNIYTLSIPAGTYVLTGFATDGETVNGTMELTVTDKTEQEFKILTCTAYAGNKDWKVGEDYSVEVEICSREGKKQAVTLGNSVTAGRKTFLALNGSSYSVSFIPNETHQAEGYMPLCKSNTLTFNANVNGNIPMGKDYTISLPADAELALGTKSAHYVTFRNVEPASVETEGDTKKITYRLAENQVYNYRTWKTNGLTQAGYFTMTLNEANLPVLSFTDADYEAFGPKTIKHDVQWNQGYETGDILVNINERGHLRMNVGDTYEAHAMRTWQLTDNTTNNYFFEPDFHYTVIDTEGKPSTGVIEIDNADTSTDPWSVIKAVGKGTAIVLVTYDAIGLNYYSSAKKTAFLGGEYRSAIWPENTAVYVVTVGEDESYVKPNMVINETYNEEARKNAGKFVDAEHDVFYYLDSEPGFTYTFTPEGAEKVEIAYPIIGTQMATYTGFGTEGVTKNGDSSYSLLLKEGRQIVRLTDASGNAMYQVLTAKTCHLDIINASREGSNIFQPGDKVKIQYSGLRHPANKLAAVYNMSAYITYNGIPNGSSLTLGSGQYTFGSSASAQAVTVDIPADYDVENTPELTLNEGVIQVNGFGDPIGNHRTIKRQTGLYSNFAAVSHKTYFGAIPDVRIPLTAVKDFIIRINNDVSDVDYTVVSNGTQLTANEDGTYTGTYGIYDITARKAGYRCYHGSFHIADDAEGEQTVNINMVAADNPDAWDGTTLTEPTVIEDIYRIATGAELAWFAAQVNSGNKTINAVLTSDIDLAGYDWTTIGGAGTAKAYQGKFNGNGHTISGLYISNADATYQGLFGMLYNATVENMVIEGEVTGKQYAGGIAASIGANSTVDRCVNNADITATQSYVGGITGHISANTAKVTNCYNTGDITAPTNCGGIAGNNNALAIVENVFNIGEITGDTYTGACVGGSSAKTNMKNMFALKEYSVTASHTLVDEGQMASGEIAVLLGEAFGQTIGTDTHPVLGGKKVYTVDDAYTNNNPAYDNIINFEDVELGETVYWNGADGSGLFMTDDYYSFLNYYNEAYNSWCGFGISRTTGTDYTGWGTPSELNSCTGGGMESRQFAVGYFSEYNFLIEDQAPAIYATQAFKPKYMHINNSAQTYLSMLNGDDFAKKFTEEDFLLLTITGLTANEEETGHVDFYLAKDGKIVNEWTKVDLTQLGAVDHIQFTMKSSDTSYGFMNTPAYFCLDNMEAELTEDIPTGISDVIGNDNHQSANGIYNVGGLKLNTLQRGVNIVRMPDGTVRKMMIR